MSIKTQRLVNRAIKAMEQDAPEYGDGFTSADNAGSYCRLKLSHHESEKFMVIFLNSQHKMIANEIMFSGTIDSASVYPREILKRALELNASALILSHNHPSGASEPSQADINITKQIMKACELVDIRVLDHIVVGDHSSVSLAQRGLI
jgi:DNA repair protein RadC